MLRTQLLDALGWTEFFDESFQRLATAGAIPARVALQHHSSFELLTEAGSVPAVLSNRSSAIEGQAMPAVGDWVCASKHDDVWMIEHVLPRRSRFVRKVPGDRAREQILAANMDYVFIVSALGADLNLRRLERYLTVAWESGAQPVVVLTKSDLFDDVTAALDEVTRVAPGVPVHAVSNITGEGIDELRSYVSQGTTCALLGSSGVGKSTLANYLAGDDVARIGDVHFTGEGKHTTTHRELIVLPGGGLLLDTPGLRELQLWDAHDGLSETFSDITKLAAGCRFSDCAHATEPGCNVRAALHAGTLDPARLQSYVKLQRELRALEMRHDKRAESEQRRKYRTRARQSRRGVIY